MTREPRPGEVRLQVKASGICGADAGTAAHPSPAHGFPITPGHEVAGVVAAVREGVAGRTIGERGGVGWFGHALRPDNPGTPAGADRAAGGGGRGTEDPAVRTGQLPHGPHHGRPSVPGRGPSVRHLRARAVLRPRWARRGSRSGPRRSPAAGRQM
ncbi:alcohol dehydrogenase catalytic domain-containing protein [Streptomyces gramineus]|uniref:alcohol dehydrogenase catalytic domain-containing protein n=1 Tax=Streptomyces gramineus TaxID=910542 RepID=UPI00398A89F0